MVSGCRVLAGAGSTRRRWQAPALNPGTSGRAEPAFELRPEANYYHQQYLQKNPHGYCPDHGTGVSCPVGVGVILGTGVKADPNEG